MRTVCTVQKDVRIVFRMVVITSSEPVGATILIQLGTWHLFVSTHDDNGGDDDNDGHLAGEMVDLVCVLAFCELPVEQRNIFVRLVFQHLWIMMMRMIIILVELIFHVYNLYFSENICIPTSTLSPPFFIYIFIWNICTPTSTPSPPPVSFFDASATE